MNARSTEGVSATVVRSVEKMAAQNEGIGELNGGLAKIEKRVGRTALSAEGIEDHIDTVEDRRAKMEKERMKAAAEMLAKKEKAQEAEKEKDRKVEVKAPSSGGKRTFKVTAYGADCRGCSGTTASGTKPTIGKTIAVDKRVIPLGTWVYLEFPDAPQYNGRYKAEDTGGAIKQNKIDLYMGTERNARPFGRKTAYVTVLK